MYRNRKRMDLEAVKAVHVSFKTIAQASIMGHCVRLVRDVAGKAFHTWAGETLDKEYDPNVHSWMLVITDNENYGTNCHPDCGYYVQYYPTSEIDRITEKCVYFKPHTTSRTCYHMDSVHRWFYFI